jgi:hypothetical protein
VKLVKPRPGYVWRYRVTVEPPVWRDATLTYRAVKQERGLGVLAEFQHAGGNADFDLGIFEAGHPSHASTRFPGFFMYAAYLDKPLDVGQRFAWQWPWQLPGGAVRTGRVKRYEGVVTAWEVMGPLPGVPEKGGRFPVARIEARLSYVEDGKVLAAAKETLWVAPRYHQVARVEREGHTPDEGLRRIVAELVEFR